MGTFKRLTLFAFLAISAVIATPHIAHSVPLLQLYAEGATYDSSTETWVFSGPGPYTLWVMGNLSGPGGKGDIQDVFLVAAYSSSETGTISITGTTASLVPDPSVALDPIFIKTVTDGSVPIMGDGSALPSHGEYGAGTTWTQYALGDFTLEDSPVADLIDLFPSYPSSSWTDLAGQISAYTVTITGYTTVHFDAFDHIASSTKSQFAPFSHDAETTLVPEPGTFLLLGSGLIGLAGWRRKTVGK